MFSEIKYYANLIISPISICLNILLLYLIIYKSSYNLSSFKKVLYLGCITDLLFGIWNFLFEPDVTVVNGIYYVFNKGILGYLPFPFSIWTFPIILFFIYFSLANVLVQFIYRYLLSCWKIMLNPFQFLFLSFFAASIVALYPTVFYIHIFTRIRSDEFYTSNLKGTEWEINGKIPPFGAFPLSEFPNVFFVAFALVVVAYIFVIFFGIKIWLGIKHYDTTVNNSVYKYQKQISIVMTIEACIPIVTLVFPILLDLTTVLIGIIIPWGGKLTMLLCCFVPILNPIVKLLVISCYRKWILKILCISRNIQITSVQSLGNRASAINSSKP